MASIAAMSNQYVRGIESYISTRQPEKAMLSRRIVKSISGVRSTVVALDNNKLLNTINPLHCPIHTQPILNGSNVRVHVCGENVVALRIDARKIDYRYDNERIFSLISLPSGVKEWCIAAARSEKLHFAGIDLLLTPEGKWHCFEINPCPGYFFFEEQMVNLGGKPVMSEWLYSHLMATYFLNTQV